ncbi:MAG TPA: alpha/beta family hydrolase [Gemmatimonadaceae bacterium]|nr:alpha/beta family hydrolase [Gemmatimonadaceae bacterium]
MADTSWTIPVGDETTTAVYRSGGSSDGVVFVAAHGAGGRLNDRSMLALAKELESRHLDVVRFNFLYREKGSGRPDQMPRLEKCFEAVVAKVREELKPRVLIIGGRSMGGRAASMMAAKGFDCDGLLLLAYPLHPPGQFDKLRDAHLPSIKVPVLCFNGTRDTFCTPELMEKVLEKVGPNWQMHWLEGADHSFHVLKSSGRNDAAVLAEVGEVTEKWLEGIKTPV